MFTHNSRRFAFLSIFVAAAAVMTWAGNAWTRGEQAPQSQTGTVVSAEAGKLVMADTAGKQASFAVTDKIPVMVNGKMSKLEDLKMGTRIHVMTDTTGGVLSVSTVDAEKLAGARHSP